MGTGICSRPYLSDRKMSVKSSKGLRPLGMSLVLCELSNSILRSGLRLGDKGLLGTGVNCDSPGGI